MPIASRQFRRILHNTALALLMVVMGFGFGETPARADKLLDETVEFTGTVIYLESKVPGMVIGVIRNGETSVYGFGKIADGSDKEPDGDTLICVSARSPKCSAAPRLPPWWRMARSPLPTGCKTGDTRFDLSDADKSRAMQGHNFDGSPMPFVPTSSLIVGAGGLYSTANDMLRWLGWHLDRFSSKDAEMRLLDHAVYLDRDGLNPAFGMDEGGMMDAMGLGWVVMRPEGPRPLILHKSGGLQGQFSFVAMAPSRGIGVFVSINEFSVGGFDAMATTTLELITELANR